MNNYWPRRFDPEGFSIERLAKNARTRIADASKENYRDLNSTKSKMKVKADHSPSPGRVAKDDQLIDSQMNGHWANRYFEEYRSVA